MNLFSIPLQFLKWRRFMHLLTLASLVLAVGMSTVIFRLSLSFQEGLLSGIERPPLLIGPKGSSTQLVWNTFFFSEEPIGTIDLSTVQPLFQRASLEKVIPLALAEEYQGFKIVGTVKDYFRLSQRYHLEKGKYFEKGSSEIVIGSEVQKRLGLKLGDFLPLAESEHQEKPQPIQIVGILYQTGTPLDHGIFGSLELVWSLHSHDSLKQQITALLVYPKDPQAIHDLFEEYKDSSQVQLVLTAPIFHRFSEFSKSGGKVVQAIAAIVLLTAALTIFLSLYTSLQERRREIGLLRALGVSRSKLFLILWLEFFLLSTLGVIGGWLLGRGATFFIQPWLQDQFGFYFSSAIVTRSEIALLFFSILFFSIVGLTPLLKLYQRNAWQEMYAPPGEGLFLLNPQSRLKIKKAFLFGIFPLLLLISGIQKSSNIPTLDDKSLKFFSQLRLIDTENPSSSDTLQSLKDQEIEIEGYMVPPLGNPLGMSSFFISSFNPNLPKCPFCYTPPPSLREMILVLSNRGDIDYTAYPVRVKGRFEIGKKEQAGLSSFYRLEMKGFQVKIVK